MSFLPFRPTSLGGILLLWTIVHLVSRTGVHASWFRRTATRVCNGHAEYCNRSYGNLTFIGAHDSYAFSADPLALARDQEVDLETQMELGVRMFQAQSHMEDGTLHFCHTSCSLFDGGTVLDYLKTMKKILDANPNDVITLLFTNPEGLSVKTVWDPVFKSSGIANMTYVPSSLPVKQSEWPTLAEMIDMGKRVVVFMDFNSNTSEVPYILPEFQMIWETPFDTVNDTFPCIVDRISGPLAQTDHMSLLNHYLDVLLFDNILIPDQVHPNTTNGVNSIIQNANGCMPVNGGRNPNFILLDWADIGNASGAATLLNSGMTVNSGTKAEPSEISITIMITLIFTFLGSWILFE